MTWRAALLGCLAALSACAMSDGAGAPPGNDDESGDYAPVDWSGPDGKADFSGVPVTFSRNTIMTDAVFTAATAVDGDAVQAFLEQTPYGTTSWLANATLDGVRFADDLVQIASAEGVDPVLLLARAQVESSIVSATVKPSTSRLASALGCACPDGESCSIADAGLSQQLHCAAKTMVQLYDESANGTGGWRIDHTRQTGDPLSVTPTTNATAALYAYTPWVLEGTGGNWLVWNVTRKYLKQFDAAGTLQLP